MEFGVCGPMESRHTKQCRRNAPSWLHEWHEWGGGKSGNQRIKADRRFRLPTCQAEVRRTRNGTSPVWVLLCLISISLEVYTQLSPCAGTCSASSHITLRLQPPHAETGTDRGTLRCERAKAKGKGQGQTPNISPSPYHCYCIIPHHTKPDPTIPHTHD
jgi:hypothetical protein